MHFSHALDHPDDGNELMKVYEIHTSIKPFQQPNIQKRNHSFLYNNILTGFKKKLLWEACNF